LVQRGGERRPLLREQGLCVEDVFAGGASGIELLLSDAKILLGLADGGTRRVERGEALGGGVARVTHGALQLAQLALDRETIAVGLDARLGELRLASAVGPEVPREADVAGADSLRLEDLLARPVGGAAALEARQPAARERGRGVFQALLLLHQREQDRVVREGVLQRVVHRRER